MEGNKIYIVDKLVIGYNHVLFNSAISSILANIYKSQSVIFICESLHAEIISKINHKYNNIVYRKYYDNLLPSNIFLRIYPWIRKKICDIIFIKRLFKSTFSDADAVFFTCLSTTSLLYAANVARKCKVPVYFFIHGEVEFLFIKNDRFVNKIKGAFYRAFLKQIGGMCKVITLSENVQQELIKHDILKRDQIINIDHPIIPANDSEYIRNPEKLILGHLGIATQKKSSDVFFSLSKQHQSDILKGVLEFQVIGKLEQDLKSIDISGVKILVEHRKLSEKEYADSIAAINYAIFTFTGDNYIYRVSGTIVDAIAHCKPFIALKHRYFDFLFDKAGNIGFLCDDINEMNEIINRLVLKDKDLLDQYNFQQTNLRNLRTQLSIQNIEQKLEKALVK